MYSLATQGNVRALRAAVQRGLNIDATDRYGNTGLCHSIYQRNYTAYNAFHASGANPRHPCIQNIPPQQYDAFMASARATPVTATPRDAYKEFADGEFVFSKTTWIVGGVLLAGGITALALGGGGGGGGSTPYYPQPDVFTPTDDSLGAFVGTATPEAPNNSPYVPVKMKNKTNTEDFTLDNDSKVTVPGSDGAADTKESLTDLINLNDSIYDYTKYIQVGQLAIDGGQALNGNVTGPSAPTITLKNNTAGIVALHNATGINNGMLNIIARNGTLGMIASDNSTIRNSGEIEMSFLGTKGTDQIDGMYADTGSTAYNDGNITGVTANGSNAGTMIGMQARIINQVKDPSTEPPTTLINNAGKNIDLSASAVSGSSISTSLVGMGSFLEKAFLDGTKLLRRAASTVLDNFGNIILNISLGDDGTYDNSNGSLLNGTGGFIGMRADANTTASNNGSIKVTVTPESATGVENSHAGMLSVHGGTITNNKDIEVKGGAGGYGMLGVRGEGTNSEFNTRNPEITNSSSGSIVIDSLNGFGMATRHGGIVKNEGKIILNSVGTGIQINAGEGTNYGKITLNNSGTGMAIKRNTTSESGVNNNASTASITNNNEIDINKADGAIGMYIEDGTAENNGTIDIEGLDTSTNSSYGMQALSGKLTNTGTINMNALTSGVESYGMHGAGSTTLTNSQSGEINFSQSGTGMYATNGSSSNAGKINMNAQASTGMSSESGAITNTSTGEITVVSGTGIKSTTGKVTNNGKVTITNGTSSVGIDSGKEVVNTNEISMTGSNLTGIKIGENGTVLNDAHSKIVITADKNSTSNYGIQSTGGDNSVIDNYGQIALNGLNYSTTVESGYGISIAAGLARNYGEISLSGLYGTGMNAEAGTLRNYNKITLNRGGYGIKGGADTETFNEDGAVIDISGTPDTLSSYGMYVEDGTARNYGEIKISGNGTDVKNYGIWVSGENGNGINNNLINILSDNSYGIFANGGEISNAENAVINMKGDGATGMQNEGDSLSTNDGTINIGFVNDDGTVVGGNNSIGMTAKGDENTIAINHGTININGDNSVGMFADGGRVVNAEDGLIRLNGNNGIVFKTSGDGVAEFYGTVEINGNNNTVADSSDGGTVINEGTVISGSTGGKLFIVGDNASFTNNNSIDVNGSNSYGVFVKDSGTGTNANLIELNAGSNNSHAMYLSDGSSGSITNDTTGTINVASNNSSGMTMDTTSTSASMTNKGQINVSGSNSKGMYGMKGGTATNEGTIKLSGTSSGNSSVGDTAAGIATVGGTVNNNTDGTIEVETGSNANAIYAQSDGGAATVNNAGTININGTGNGIYSIVQGSSPTGTLNTINNSGTININAGSGSGIYANAATISNSATGNINVGSSGATGIFGDGVSTTITNDGTISVTGSTANGVHGKGTINNNGTVKVSGTNARGIWADGSGSKATNNKLIEATGNGSIGIYLTNGANADNELNGGSIVSSGNGSIGILADGGTATNSREIVVSGNGAIGMQAKDGTVQNGRTEKTQKMDENGQPIEGEYIYTNIPGTIDVSGESAIGMKLTGTGTILNNADSNINVSGSLGIGMLSQGTGTTENIGTITVSGTNAVGMQNSGTGTTKNKKNITVNNNNSSATGMKATAGTAENDVDGVITVSGIQNSGMTAAGGSIVNNGTITADAESSSGMTVQSGSGTNNKTITNSGLNGHGMTVSGGSATNETGGTIEITGENGVGIFADGGTATNKGTIIMNADNGIAYYASGGTVVNASGATVTMTKGKYIMYADAGTARNDGTLNLTAANAVAMMSEGGLINNAGTLNISGSSSKGMVAGTGGQAQNNGTITVTGSAVGMAASGGTATNMSGKTINANGTGVIGMFADAGTAINANGATINLGSASAIGMKATGTGTVTNSGTISINSNGAIAMLAEGGTANNTGTLTLASNMGNSYLMQATNNGKLINSGTLTTNAAKAAMDVVNGSATNNNIINASGTNSSGINVASGSGVNTKTINVSGSGAAGMIATGSGSTVTNSTGATITASSSDGIGMKALNGGTAINANGATITVTGANGIGMLAQGSGSKAKNLGTININTVSANAVGMKAINGGSVENAGTINLMDGAKGTGIYIGNASTLYNSSTGKIVFENSAEFDASTDTIGTEGTQSAEVKLCADGTTTCADSRFIYMAAGSKLVNSGLMTTAASFRLNELGDGDFIMGSTGKLEAGEEISGDFYVMSDEAMLAQGQKDVYINENALQASSITAAALSASPMWRASLVDSAKDDNAADNALDTDNRLPDAGNADNSLPGDGDGNSSSDTESKDIVYERVGFNELVNNAEVAAYLESNYAIRNGIYDPMMLANSMAAFDQAVVSGLGLDLFPNFAKQNMDLIKSVNRQMNSAVFNNDQDKEYRAIVGYDYFDREQDGTNGLTGYKDHASSVYGLFDKKVNSYMRMGLGVSFSKFDSEYDNGSERTENVTQVMAPISLEGDKTKFVSMPQIGLGIGDYKRFDQGVEYKADTRNYYYGVTNEARHEIDFDIVTLEPVAEFNVLGLYQNRTKENIRVEGTNNLSIEGGLGLYAKKKFSLGEDDEIRIRLGGTYYHEFNNPYKAAEAGIVGLNGRYHMGSYEAQRNRGVFSARLDYKRGRFNFYIEGNQFVEDDSTYSLNAGINYAF